MTDYFEELNCRPIEQEQNVEHQLLLMVRFLNENGYDQILNMPWSDEVSAPPASKEVVKNLKRRLVTTEDEKCAICLAPNTDLNGEQFVQMPCKHEFHDTCIIPWLEKTNSCCICRHELKTDDEVYEQRKKHRAREQQRQEELEILHNSMFG